MPGYAVLGFGIALAVILCAILVWSNFRVATDDKQKGDQAQPSIIEVIKTSHLPSPPVSGSGQV